MPDVIATAAGFASLPSRARQFYALTKPRVVRLIVFCALIGMLLAVPGLPDWRRMVAAVVGIWLVASAAAVLNCLLERQVDARMSRTAWRPTARGDLSAAQALVFSALLCAIGVVVLRELVNALTMWLTLGTLVGYAVIYTVVLKPLTPQNIVIGGASGAMPPVLGWAAMCGEVGAQAAMMWLIIFLWTPPHFWSLALYRVDDYRNAGIPMLPVTHGGLSTRRHVFGYTLALAASTLLPVATGMSGAIYLVAALTLGSIYTKKSWQLLRFYSDERARQTFRFSIVYLALLFLALLIDHYARAYL
jgi:protoheme IX farnesyltransferase